MKIRRRLTWMLVILSITSIMVVISFSILYIKDFLRREGLRRMEKEGRVTAMALGRLSVESKVGIEEKLNLLSAVSGYQMAVLDAQGQSLWRSGDAPMINPSWRRYITAAQMPAVFLPDSLTHGGMHVLVQPLHLPPEAQTALATSRPPAWLLLMQREDVMLAPLTDIRWIIYNAMFITAGLVALLIAIFSRQFAQPIVRVRDIAQKLARRQWEAIEEVHRRDEIGSIARALNQMARELKDENERLQTLYARQRQFYADITHELGNPLHTLMGALEMLEMPQLSAEQRLQLARTAQNQGQRLAAMFRDLKTHQQYDEDPHFVRPRTVSLQSILTAVQDAYQGMAAQKNIGLQVAACPQQVVADPERLQAVLENLVNNALKYTPEGGEVRVRCTPSSEVPGDLQISVEDTGIGIAPEHQPKIFDRFYRTEKARSRDQGGTGLGLSVVKIILQAHGRDIHLESTPGRGSRFYFALALAGEEAPARLTAGSR